jgi:FkbM family methyltransferase
MTRYCVWDVDENSVVWDVGGYEGEWTRRMVERYDCIVHLFEPTPRAFKVAQQRLAGQPKVHLHQVALGAESKMVTFYDCERDGASVYGEGGPALVLPMLSFAEFLGELGIAQIDMMSLNIEGGEYDLFEHLLGTGLISRIKEMMVQWHWRQEGDDKRQRALQERIAETHKMRWNHAAWEAWRRK